MMQDPPEQRASRTQRLGMSFGTPVTPPVSGPGEHPCAGVLHAIANGAQQIEFSASGGAVDDWVEDDISGALIAIASGAEQRQFRVSPPNPA